MTVDEARERCLALNLSRRHLTPEEVQAARAQRIGRVAAARSKGKSIRAIAAMERVSKSMIARDLADRPADSPPLPDRITALNGCTYPVRPTKPRHPGHPAQRAAAALLQFALAVKAIVVAEIAAGWRRCSPRPTALRSTATTGQHWSPCRPSSGTWPAVVL